MAVIEIAFIIVFGTLALVFGAFSLTSLHEYQKRASRLAGLGMLASLALCIVLIFSPTAVQGGAALTLGVVLSGLLIWFFWPVQQNSTESPPPNKQVDERTIMFARARLAPGSDEFSAYYEAHPEHLSPDTSFRQNPGLLSEGRLFRSVSEQFPGSLFLSDGGVVPGSRWPCRPHQNRQDSGEEYNLHQRAGPLSRCNRCWDL